MTDLAQRRQQLEDRLTVLDERLHEIGDELESHQSKDWEELATEREGDEVLEQLGLSAQEEIVRIRAALKRMDEGEYGFLHEMRGRDFRGASGPVAMDPVLPPLRGLTQGAHQKGRARRMRTRPCGDDPPKTNCIAGSRISADVAGCRARRRRAVAGAGRRKRSAAPPSPRRERGGWTDCEGRSGPGASPLLKGPADVPIHEAKQAEHAL